MYLLTVIHLISESTIQRLFLVYYRTNTLVVIIKQTKKGVSIFMIAPIQSIVTPAHVFPLTTRSATVCSDSYLKVG